MFKESFRWRFSLDGMVWLILSTGGGTIEGNGGEESFPRMRCWARSLALHLYSIQNEYVCSFSNWLQILVGRAHWFVSSVEGEKPLITHTHIGDVLAWPF